MPIFDGERVSRRTFSALERLNCETWADVAAVNFLDLEALSNVGNVTLYEIIDILAYRGLCLEGVTLAFRGYQSAQIRRWLQPGRSPKELT